MVITYTAVMIGGAIGALLRMSLSDWITSAWGGSFPWGTMAVNVSGCLAIGLFFGALGSSADSHGTQLFRSFVVFGLLGGFTTFSSFSFQTLGLIMDGQVFSAVWNVILSLTLCLLATWLGIGLGRSLFPS